MMFFERLKEIQQRVDQESIKFINNIQIPIKTEHPLCSSLLDGIKLYLQSPKQPKNPFQPILAQFNHAAQITKTSSRLCGGILKKGDRAYKCLQCITEDNSIVCLGCFELEKHKGHQFELISVFGGCCDCGDPQKWRPQGFCKKHSDDEDIQIILDKDLLSKFIKQQHFCFKIALHFYGEYLEHLKYVNEIKITNMQFSDEEYKKLRSSLKTKMKVYLEAYFVLYIKQLIDFNSNGKYANSMTQKLFESFVDLSQLPSVQCFTKKETNFFKLLFFFVELDKTPEKICQLCITLFQLKNFRETLTVEYINNYITSHDFPSSTYSHLSSQLFTSYLAISKLVRQKRIPPLSIHPLVEQAKHLEDAAQGYVRYYYDINYLSKLYGDASIQYFIYHAQKNKIGDLCDYRRVFNNFPTSKDYYGLEEIFVTRMINFIKVIQRDRSGFIMKASLRQLYHQFTTYDTKVGNYYRPHERLFTMIAFLFVGGDLSKFDDEQIMVQFLAILGVQNLEMQAKTIINNICTIISFAAHLIQNQRRVNQNFTFYSFYFKKNVTLFNLDAILLKIIIKMCEFHNRHTQPQINYSQMIKNGDKFFNIINKMQEFVANPQENEFITTKQIGITLQQCHLKHCFYYLFMLNEAIVSDLPILAIKCFLQPTKEQIDKYQLSPISYEESARHYYRNILKSCQNTKIQIKDFKIICDAFFKEEDVFKSFVKAHIDANDNRRLDAQTSKGIKVNLQYFKSVCIRTTGINPNGSLSCIPYNTYTKTAPFIQNDLVKLVKKSIDFVLNMEKALQTANTANIKIIVQDSFKIIFNFAWMIYIQTENQQIYNFILQTSRIPQFKYYLEHLSKEIRSYGKNKGDIEEEGNSEEKEMNKNEQMIKKGKLQNKRNLMRQKMNKNKDFFLPQQKPQKIQQQQQQQFCCLCKQNKQDEDNCLIAMLSETNYNNWSYISSLNNLYTLSSCGHQVHRSCYKKIIKQNQIYSFCPLCKKAMNMIIPKPSNKQNQNSMAHFWQEFHCLNRNYHNQHLRKNDGQIMFLSLVAFIAIKGLLFYDNFKKQVKVYRSLVDLLRYFYKQNQLSLLFESKHKVKSLTLREKNQQIDNIFHFLSSQIFQQLFSVESYYDKSKFSKDFQQHTKHLIKSIFSCSTAQCMQVQLKQLDRMRQTITHPHIQPNLSQLSSKYMGKCPNCSLVTNQQAICLICPQFVTCIKCQNIKLMAHSLSTHKAACSFIKTHTGEIVYIFRNRFWVFESVYEDYMGRNYQMGNKTDYNLNMKKIEPIWSDIASNGIQAKLRYKEKQANKVNHDQQL